MNYAFFIARRYFRKGRGGYLFLTNLFAIISVAVGVACLILVLGVMNGFDRDLKEKIIGVFPPLTIQLPRNDEPFVSWVQERILSLSEVEAIAPFSETQAIFRSQRFLTAGILRAVDIAKEDRVTNFKKFIIAGAPGKGLIIGSQVAENLKVKIGEPLQIITGFGTLPRALPVVAIFHTGLYHFDVSTIYVPLSDCVGLFPGGSYPEALGIRIRDIYEADNVSRKISQLLGTVFRTESWISKNRILFSALALERRAMATILVLIILVAGFNIATSLMMTVWRKNKEIGILRSLGVSRAGIQAVFLWMGFLTGLWGVAIGLATGLGLAYIGDRYQLVKLPGYIYDLSYLPIKVQGTDILWIGAAAFAIALLASIFPSREAAKVAPAVSLRTE